MKAVEKAYVGTEGGGGHGGVLEAGHVSKSKRETMRRGSSPK